MYGADRNSVRASAHMRLTSFADPLDHAGIVAVAGAAGLNALPPLADDGALGSAELSEVQVCDLRSHASPRDCERETHS